jgi:adenylate kinase
LDGPSLAYRQAVAESSKESEAQTSRSITEQKRRKVVIVGIPGVGKSTVVNKIVELMTSRNHKTTIVNYGTVMMEEASKLHGVKSRDDMRKLPVEVQRKLQVYAASRISLIQEEFVIIDTHLFIATKEGYWPGMPMDVLLELKPTHLVLVSATDQEIRSRRENDDTRARDLGTMDSLNLELEAARTLLFASSIICGCPALIVNNSDGEVDSAAGSIIDAVFTN